MGRETSSKPSANASTSGVKPGLRGERAAQGQPQPEEDDDDAYGDPSKVQDQGILESLGEAVSSPVRDETEKPLPQREHKRSL